MLFIPYHPVDKSLGYLRLLAKVSNAAMNIHGQVSA